MSVNTTNAGRVTEREPHNRRRSFLDAYHVHPFAGPVVAAVAHVPRRFALLQWYALVEYLPGARTSGGGTAINVRRGGAADADAMVRVGDISAYEVRHRLGRGDIPYLAWKGDIPVGYKWFRIGSWREVNIEFALRGNEAWSYDLYVAPAFRGEGIGATLTNLAVDDLAAEGITRVLCAIYHLNRPSLASARRAGARIVRSYVVFTLGPFEYVSERDSASGRHRGTMRAVSRRLHLAVPPPASAAVAL